MEMTTIQYQGNLPVTILRVEGILDTSSESELTAKAAILFNSGVRNLVLDLSRLTDLSGEGINALHQVALIFETGKRNEEQKTSLLRRENSSPLKDKQKHVKLLNPPDPIRSILDLAGLSGLFEIFDDVYSAINSFN